MTRLEPQSPLDLHGRDSLEGLLAALVEHSRQTPEIQPFAICLRRTRDDASTRVIAAGGIREACTACPLTGDDTTPCHRPVQVPIHRGSRLTGLVVADAEGPQPLEALARQVSRWVQRETLGRRARKRVGRDLWLLGSSDGADRVESFIDWAAPVKLPALVRGEAGTGREDVAFALHLLSDHAEAPFVKLDGTVAPPEDWHRRLDERLESARGGTFFLAAVDHLPQVIQSELADRLRAGASTVNVPDPPRLVASTLPRSVAGGANLHPTLEQELAFLEIEVEPLRARPADIGLLAQHFARLYGREDTVIEESALRRLERYPWPGNIPQLRQVIGRLVSLANGSGATLETLRTTAPEIFDPLDRSSPAGEQSATEPPTTLEPEAKALERAPDSSIVHPAVARALRYLDEHSAEPLTLAIVAKAAHSSPSHLSHLFRKTLGISPMAHLNELRLERARNLLSNCSEQSVTEVAWATGFGDLRHFERMFKRSTGVTPSQFRERSDATVRVRATES